MFILQKKKGRGRRFVDDPPQDMYTNLQQFKNERTFISYVERTARDRKSQKYGTAGTSNRTTTAITSI
jgi:hypothetical protein